MSEGKGVGDVSYVWGVDGRVNGYDVESDGTVLPAAGLEKGLSSTDQTLLLGAVDGLFGPDVGFGPATADFNEDHFAAMASDQVDLGWAGVDVAGQDAQAFLSEEFFSQLLCLLTLGSAMGEPIHLSVYCSAAWSVSGWSDSEG